MVILANVNGVSAYKTVSGCDLYDSLKGFGFDVVLVEDEVDKIKHIISQKHQYPRIIYVRTDVEQYPFLKGIDAHYCTITKEDYESTQ
jgi:hypothetical protein